MNERIYQHKYYLNKKTSNHRKLQNDWNEFGENNFIFEILEKTENLDSLEKYYIEKFDSVKNGYNDTYGGVFGNRQSEDQIKKRKIKMSGKNNPMYGMNGELNPNCKLLESTVIEIKKMISDNIDDLEIIKIKNISKNQFYKIKHKRTWKHIV